MTSARNDDLAFMADLRANASRGPVFSANLLMLSVFVFFSAFIFWSAISEIDQITIGQGRVIPSSDIQVVQTLDGGIVNSIAVREGAIVKQGQVIAEIDATGFEAKFKETQVDTLALKAKIARLKAETEGTTVVFDPEVLEKRKNAADHELQLMNARAIELKSAQAILKDQIQQKEQEIIEVRSKIQTLERALGLARKQRGIIAPHVEAGAVATMELLVLDREIASNEGELEAARLSIPRIESVKQESERRLTMQIETFRSEAFAELTDAENKLASLTESITALVDKVNRKEVKSPVDGVVKKIYVTTIGGVIAPGEAFAEIVPIEDNLLIEANIKPSDVAFLHPGQLARVKITAYDFGTYGAMEGKLERIGADTVVDDQGNSFYEIEVRTDRNYLGTQEKPLPIIPGMVAEVDIITGKRTVLEYLLKPFSKARQAALRER